MRNSITTAFAIAALALTLALPTHAQQSRGVQTSYLAAAATTNATLVKATPGSVFHYSLSNTTATIYYLRMYNLAVAPTCTSATGFKESIMIPASTTGGGRERPQISGQVFNVGIGYCITANAASTDNNAAGVGVLVTILFN